MFSGISLPVLTSWPDNEWQFVCPIKRVNNYDFEFHKTILFPKTNKAYMHMTRARTENRAYVPAVKLAALDPSPSKSEDESVLFGSFSEPPS